MEQGSFKQVLKNPYFMLLWSAQVFSQLADKIFFLFMVVLVTKDQFSNSAISGLTIVFTIPAVIFGSVAGVFVDRWDKKTIMVTSNLFRAGFILMLPLSDKLLYLYLITFLVSTLTQFFAPAETSMIPSIVQKKDLLPANSLFMGTMLGSVVLGFSLGAPVISKYSHDIVRYSIAAMYLFSAVLLFYIKTNETAERADSQPSSFFREFAEGLRYVRKSKVILFSLLRLIIIFSAFAALSVLVIGFVNDILNLKPVYFGYLLALAGLGMGIGAGFSGKFGNKIGKETLVFSGFIFTGITLLLLANTNLIVLTLLNQPESFRLIYALVVVTLVGFSAALSVIPLQTILQEIVEPNMRGKVFGVQNMAVNTAMTLPMALAGIAADLLDKRFFELRGVSVVMMLTGLIVLLGGLLENTFKPEEVN